MIINSEVKRLLCRVEGGDARWKLYWLPVVNGRAEAPQGDGIARAWIAGSGGISQNTSAPLFVPEGTVAAASGRFVKITFFFLLIIRKKIRQKHQQKKTYKC